jgi:Holliday junction resolvasome RuvABC endonuclease subunit
MNLIGIDLGVHKIALACFTNDALVWADAHEAPREQARDLQLRELASFASEIATLHGAESVWIEDTIIGNNRKYSIGLAQSMGAVLSAMAQLRLSQGLDTRVVDNKTWKKDVVGSGNADKTAIKHYIDVTHPSYAPLCGADEDLYDAACVGLYGLATMERASHLDLQS